MMNFARNATLRNIFLFLILFTIVIIVNQPLIAFDMIYQEQACIYLANQTIHNWHDLLNIYLHPAWLNMNIPFFRPSGHFLIYQILMPIFGWHNTFAMNIISFTFLTLIGFFVIKLYRLLFPGYQAGALIAFSIYLMHPSLTISRLTFMHFDFAYVFFLVLSLYYFVLFCQNQKNFLFILSMFLYAIAVTFKEPAIMLGPVLFCYFIMSAWPNFSPKKRGLILSFITLTSGLISWYLFLSWPSLHYAGNKFDISHSLGTANILIKDLFAINHSLIPFGTLPFKDYAWRTTLFTPETRFIMWLFFWLSLICFLLVCKTYRKSLVFLLISAMIFTILPLCWASGAPWHHSPTLICLTLIMGFSVEYFLKKSRHIARYIYSYCIVIALVISSFAIWSNFENIIKYYLVPEGFLGLSVNRNAIHSPPDIKNKLNAESILVVEDSILHNDYFMGNSAYPFLLFFTNQDYDYFYQREKSFYLKFHHTYSGHLFRYAFLMPSLKEELYPFRIELMDDIPNEIIYNWLKHYNNIFCVGYDASANWYDKTNAFKKALLKQQASRKLVIHSYREAAVNNIQHKITHTKDLPVPDSQLCEFTCDQMINCDGFIYRHTMINQHHEIRCEFWNKTYATS